MQVIEPLTQLLFKNIYLFVDWFNGTYMFPYLLSGTFISLSKERNTNISVINKNSIFHPAFREAETEIEQQRYFKMSRMNKKYSSIVDDPPPSVKS